MICASTLLGSGNTGSSAGSSMQPFPTCANAQPRRDILQVVAKWSAWASLQPKVACCSGERSADLAAQCSGVVGDVKGSEFIDLSSALELQNIRESLVRQEDTIIFSIIERAQFAANSAVYESEAVPVPEFSDDGHRYSLLEYILRQTEQLHGRIRRFTSPDEHAFFPDAIPNLVLPPLKYPEVLAPHAKDININDEIMSMYLKQLLPSITTASDDGNYGSSACYDVLCLQALSKRIHYGKFVAEAKFQSHQRHYLQLIQQKDAEGIMDALTDRDVEEKVIDRVRWKAATYGQEIQGAPSDNCLEQALGQKYKVSPDTIAMLYEKWVMPMTKEVQVQYLLRRLDR